MKNETEFIKRLIDPKTRERAFVELLDRYQERLYWHIRKLVGSHQNADDVLQNTFVRVYKSLPKFQQKSTLHTWMYRIAYNESVRFLERNKTKYYASINDLEQKHLESLVAKNYFDGSEVASKLKRALTKLSEKQKLIFQMKYYDDLKFREIATILSAKENTVKTTYYSAAKLIEHYLLEVAY